MQDTTDGPGGCLTGLPQRGPTVDCHTRRRDTW